MGHFVGVAVGNYVGGRHGVLEYAVSDVAGFQALLGGGFTGVPLVDPDEVTARRRLQELEGSLVAGGPLVVLWCGHGVDSPNGLRLLASDSGGSPAAGISAEDVAAYCASTDVLWHHADLIALDLEGTGAQDRDREAILEIALVPLADGHPVITNAYSTLVNPGRRVPARPWISPGLTNGRLQHAPSLIDIEPRLATRINGHWLVGHNIGVDRRLLHRTCPTIIPAGLIDTLRLARTSRTNAPGHSLTVLLDHFHLTNAVNQAAPDGEPHRALWDAVGAAVLLDALINWISPDGCTLAEPRGLVSPVSPAFNDAPDPLF